MKTKKYQHTHQARSGVKEHGIEVGSYRALNAAMDSFFQRRGIEKPTRRAAISKLFGKAGR